MHDISLILLLTFGLAFALLFGALTQKLGLSPIVGYLLAGIAAGPYTPGFVGDPEIAAQLAELGVVLLMFGVGLQFHASELLRVKGIAIPGACVQSAVSLVLCAGVAMAFGWTLGAGLVLGLAVSVASTVVLIRLLLDFNLLHQPQGHVAVGWLVVEDIFTVLVLVLLPAFHAAQQSHDMGGLVLELLWVVGKLTLLVLAMMLFGRRVLPRLMNAIARTRSRELFTLAVLAVALGIATGSALLFGVSMALGAFLAGMVVGQSDVSHQAAADALPFRDAFAVLFFVSVGMLFDPSTLIEHPGLVLSVLLVILVGKPLAAFVIVLLLRHPLKIALTVAFALAQIGEFSFILGEQARALGYLPETGASVLVTGAIVSITLNPILFRLVGPTERWLRDRPRVRLWIAKRLKGRDPTILDEPPPAEKERPRAVVIGYGPVGQTLTRILDEFRIDPTIVDLNVETIRMLRAGGYRAIYGDATRPEILRSAGVESADYVLISLPDGPPRDLVMAAARALRKDVPLIVRARYLNERAALEKAGVAAVAYEEAEVAVALAAALLRAIGMDEDAVRARTEAVRQELKSGQKVKTGDASQTPSAIA